MEERHLSLSEAADALNISERTAYRWIKSGKLRAYKPGRDYWIPESAIKEVVKESEVRPKVERRSSLEPSFNDILAETERPVGKESAATVHMRTTATARPAVLYILRRVAQGEISPEEGAQEFEAIFEDISA
jgi:excisionase family DNA binding protein